MLKNLLIISSLTISLLANDVVKELSETIKPLENLIISLKTKYKTELIKEHLYDLQYCSMFYNEDQFIKDELLISQLNKLNNDICNYTYFFNDKEHLSKLMNILNENDKTNLNNLQIKQLDYFKKFMSDSKRNLDSELFFKK